MEEPALPPARRWCWRGRSPLLDLGTNIETFHMNEDTWFLTLELMREQGYFDLRFVNGSSSHLLRFRQGTISSVLLWTRSSLRRRSLISRGCSRTRTASMTELGTVSAATSTPCRKTREVSGTCSPCRVMDHQRRSPGTGEHGYAQTLQYTYRAGEADVRPAVARIWARNRLRLAGIMEEPDSSNRIF